jgi:ribosomal protein S18 acetylase RimI-like enzyme
MAAINRQCLTENYPLDLWEGIVAQHCSFVVAHAGTVIGYLLCQPAEHERTANISSFAVLPPYRGQRVGSSLLAACVALAQQKRWLLLTLQVREDNAGGRRLYERCGFREIGRRAGYYSDGGTGLTMALAPSRAPRIL